MIMTRNMLAAACVLLVGLPIQLIGEEPDGALEQVRIETFADALMNEEANCIYAHVRDLDMSDPEFEDALHWFDGFRHPVTPLQLVSSYPIQLPPVVFEFYGIGVSIPPPESDGPYLIMMSDSEWLVVLAPLVDSEWEQLAERMESIGSDHTVTPGNVFRVFRRSYGGICVNQGPDPLALGPDDTMEHIYPVSVVKEVRRIYDVMSSGGDTNALLALENGLELDFSRKLVQEIVRRKQPPPPPTQEEIWREEITEMWRGGWQGAAERGEDLRGRVRDYERQFRAAHEAGEMSDETYLAMMKLIRLDLKNNPKATHLRHTTPPRVPSAPVQP